MHFLKFLTTNALHSRYELKQPFKQARQLANSLLSKTHFICLKKLFYIVAVKNQRFANFWGELK